jgi:hypothetical protein
MGVCLAPKAIDIQQTSVNLNLNTQPNELFFSQILTMIQTQLTEIPEIKYSFIDRVIPQMLICLNIHLILLFLVICL